MILILTWRQASIFGQNITVMGFADLSIAEIAEDYNFPVEDVCRLCDKLGITYKTSQTRLALEDAKAIIAEILSVSAGE